MRYFHSSVFDTFLCFFCYLNDTQGDGAEWNYLMLFAHVSVNNNNNNNRLNKVLTLRTILWPNPHAPLCGFGRIERCKGYSQWDVELFITIFFVCVGRTIVLFLSHSFFFFCFLSLHGPTNQHTLGKVVCSHLVPNVFISTDRRTILDLRKFVFFSFCLPFLAFSGFSDTKIFFNV